MKKRILSGIMAVALLASTAVMAQNVQSKGKQEVKKEVQRPQTEAKKEEQKKKNTSHKKEHAKPANKATMKHK